MSAHKRLSASNTKRFWNCAGSVALEDNLPDELKDRSSASADMGTCAHGLLERCLASGVYPEKFLGRALVIIETEDDYGVSMLSEGKTPPNNKVWFEADFEMVEAVAVCYEYVLSRLLELFPTLYDESMDEADVLRDAIENKRLFLERSVTPVERPNDDSGGTADITIDAWPDMLEVIDYKNGTYAVEARGNHQTRSYQLGVARPDAFAHDRYRTTIVQPRSIGAGGSIRSEEFEREELMAWGRELESRMEKVDEADASYAAGTTDEEMFTNGHLVAGDHCYSTFCPMMSTCPAARRLAERTAGADFDEDPVDLPVPSTIEKLAAVGPYLDFLDFWCKAVRVTQDRLLRAGNKVPGVKLVVGSSNRVLNPELDVEDVVETLTSPDEEWGLSKDQLYTEPQEPKLLTGPAMEKLFKGRGSGAKKGKFADKFLHKPEGNIIMVDESDDRPAVEVGVVESEFPDDLDQ